MAMDNPFVIRSGVQAPRSERDEQGLYAAPVPVSVQSVIVWL